MDARPSVAEARALDRTSRSGGSIVRRGAGAGALAGLVTGAIAGTLLVPLFGTIIGLVVGTVYGLVLGSVGAAVLAAFADGLDTRPKAATASALLAAFTGGPAFAAFDLGWQIPTGGFVVCAGIGALVGPRVVLGDRPW